MQTADITPAEHATPAPSQAAYSRFWQRLHRRYDALLPLLPPGPPTRATMETALQTLRAQNHDVGAALRILRQLVM